MSLLVLVPLSLVALICLITLAWLLVDTRKRTVEAEFEDFVRTNQGRTLRREDR